MKHPFFSLSLLFFLLINCTPEKKNNHQPLNLTEIKIDSSVKIKESWFEIIEEIEFTPLKTTKETLIGGVDKIISYKNRYYIWDRLQKSIFVFKHCGSFDFKIDSRGRGPKEYKELRDFYVDIDENIFILDYGRILQFDKQGNFKKEIDITPFIKKVKAGPLQFSGTKENGWLFWIGSQSSFTNTPSLYATDNSLNINYSKFMIGTEDPDYTRFYNTFENTLLTADWLNDTIYQINNQEIYPKFVIDFGENDLNESKIKNIKKGKEMHDFLLNNDFCYRIHNVLNSPKHLVFNHGINRKVRTVFYNKEKQSVFYGWRVFPSPQLPGLIKNTDGDYFIGILFPSSFANNKENIPTQYKEMFANVNEIDNPIVFKFKVK